MPRDGMQAMSSISMSSISMAEFLSPNELLDPLKITRLMPVGRAQMVVPPDPGWPVSMPVTESAVLLLANKHRVEVGQQALGLHSTLVAAAQWKARWMAASGIMAHDDSKPPVDRSWNIRIADNGFPSQLVGENIAYGYPTPDAVMAGWLASPGHKQNLEAAYWSATGIGAVTSATGLVWWCQDFGGGVAPDNPTPGPTPNPGQSVLAQWLHDVVFPSGSYVAWKRDNPKEEKKLAALIAAPSSAVPVMKTNLGKLLVDSVKFLAAK